MPETFQRSITLNSQCKIFVLFCLNIINLFFILSWIFMSSNIWKFKFHIWFLPTKKLIFFKTSKYPFSYVNWKQIPLNFFNFNWKFTHCVTPSLRWRQSHSDLKFKIQFGNWPFLNKYICSEYVESMLLWFISKSWKLLLKVIKSPQMAGILRFMK